MHPPVRVCIYIDTDCWAGSVLLVKELLAVAGTLHAANPDLARAALFSVTLVGPSMAPVRAFTGDLLQPDFALAEAPPAEVLVLPAFYQRAAPRPSPALNAWLARHHSAGGWLMALTSGVLMLAATGLLDGHEAAANLADRRAFGRYPRVRFATELPLAIDGRIITAANINPVVEACIFLVGRFHGDKAALKLARYTNTGAAPPSFTLATAPWKQHADQRIRAAQVFIERHFQQDITLEDAARRAAMSERNFSRRFRAATGMAPSGYLTHCRLEHAKQLLAAGKTGITQVAAACGYADPASFRRAFKRANAVSPTKFRAQ